MLKEKLREMSRLLLICLVLGCAENMDFEDPEIFSAYALGRLDACENSCVIWADGSEGQYAYCADICEHKAYQKAGFYKQVINGAKSECRKGVCADCTERHAASYCNSYYWKE